MKKKKLLKRIEELERRNTQLKDKYKRVLFEDDKKAILMERFIYKQDEKHEQLFLKGLTSGVTELETEQKVFKYLHPPTLSDLENMKYHHDSILFNKYCKECKYPILRLDKLATVLKNGQRIFNYEK